MRKALLALIVILVLVPAALAVMQGAPRMEITGLNPQDLPVITVTVNVFDDLGQPVPDLTTADFTVTGDLADRARVVSVTDISSEEIPISVVLAIDVSGSMAGSPIESAQIAASSFVDAIGPNDPVAIITFSSGVKLNQDFTTNRATLNGIIDNLAFGGQTFLYDGTLAAVDKATQTDNPRRAVIVLSDGAHYDTGPFSQLTRDESIQRAVVNGVPVYTIGLGFGADRTYLEAISANTNARFRESPTPAELDAIFSELADLLRTQYEVVLEVDVPQDGQVYDLDLQVTTPQGIATATGRLRAPVPVPVVTLPVITGAVSELTEVEAQIIADDALTGVEITLDGASQITLTEEPYLFLIDPVALPPGAHSLAFTATDEDDESGSSTLIFEVAALPSQVQFNPELGSEFADQQTIALDITGQTPPVSVTISQDGGDPVALTEPFSFVIDPPNIAFGNHTVTVSVENAGGVLTSVDGTFTVPDIPPQFTISGLDAGQELSSTVEVGVNIVSSQAPATDIAFAINGETISSAAGTVQLSAFDLQPGSNTLDVTVTTELGQSTTNSLNFTVAALPPSFSVVGLAAGDLLDSDRAVAVENIVSQTEITGIAAQVDGQAVTVTGADTLILEVLLLGAGDHTLSITVTNAGGQSVTTDVPFAIAAGPQETATAQALPTNTPNLTDEPTATSAALADNTATPAVESTATEQTVVDAAAQVAMTETADAILAQAQQATANAAAQQAVTETAVVINEMIDQTATAEAQALQATPVDDAQLAITETAAAINELMGQTATADLVATVNAQATADAAALSAQQAITETAVVISEMINQTATAEAISNAQAALDAQATADAESTLSAAVELTSAAEDAQATAAAQTTADAQAVLALATENAQATTDAESVANAQATTDAEATANAQATLDAAPTETREPTATDEPTEAPTEVATEVEPTEAGTAVAQVATEVEATPTSAGEDGTPVPTITPIGTLIPAQAQTTPSNDSIVPIVVIIVVVIVILLLAYFVLSRGRQQRR